MLRLSTGEKQRLALLRGLLGNPKALLLDEPTGALDPASQASVEAVLRQHIDQGCAIILVTHDRDKAARLANRHFVTQAGRLTSE